MPSLSPDRTARLTEDAVAREVPVVLAAEYPNARQVALTVLVPSLTPTSCVIPAQVAVLVDVPTAVPVASPSACMVLSAVDVP